MGSVSVVSKEMPIEPKLLVVGCTVGDDETAAPGRLIVSSVEPKLVVVG